MPAPEDVYSHCPELPEEELLPFAEQAPDAEIANSPTQHLLLCGKVIEQDGRLINASTGDWYMPHDERNGKPKKAYLEYLREGEGEWSVAIGVHSPNYADEALMWKRLMGKNTHAAGHTWLTLLGPSGQKAVTEANVAKGRTLDAFRQDLNPDLPAYRRIINRGRQMLATEERVVDDRDNNNRYPHSIMEIFITPRMAGTLQLDIAAHEWTSGRSSDFKSARFNGVNFRGQNCTGYVTSLLEGVGIDFNRLVGTRDIPLVNDPVFPYSMHRAAYRLAQALGGVVLPERGGTPSTTVHPVDFNDSSKGNVYILDTDRRLHHKGSVSGILQDARSHGVVVPDKDGSLTSYLPEGLDKINETFPATSETHELPQEAIEHVAKLLQRRSGVLQVTQRYSAGSNGSTFRLGENIVLKIFEPDFSSKTSQDFSRSATIQRILYSNNPDLVPKIYEQEPSFLMDNLMLPGVGKPFMLMERVTGKTVEQPTAEDAASLGRTLAQFHRMSGAIIGELGEGAFENTPKATRRADPELLGQVVRVATGLAEPSYTSLGMLVRSAVSAPLLHYKLDAKDLPRGVLHMDFHWPNCLLGDKPRIIDFDTCAIGAFVEDIGNTMMLSFMLPENGGVGCRVDLAQSFLEGYNSIRQLTPDEFKALPVALKEQATRIVLRNNRYAARTGHWAARVMSKDQFAAVAKAFVDNLPLLRQMIAGVASDSRANAKLS